MGEQHKVFTPFTTQINHSTGQYPPSEQQQQQQQQQLYQATVPIQPPQQQIGGSIQYPLTNRQHQQQHLNYSNDNITPFHYNPDHIPPLYSSSGPITHLQPQHDSQLYPQHSLQMNTYAEPPPPAPPQQQQQYVYDSNMKSNTRLSDEDNEQYTTDQWKMMTSKERRQQRNKVSARNFRNRRKEYITSLEEQVDTFKNENMQLQLEIKWVRTTLNKLQKENDNLRVKLALCQGGITTKQESTLSDRRSSQGLSPPTATTTTPSVPQSPVLPLLADHPPSVQHTLTTTDTNTSQKPATSALAQNGNSSFIIPDLHGSSHRPQQQQQQHTSPLSLPMCLDSAQQQFAPIHPRESNEKSNPSVSSSPGTNLDSIATSSTVYHAGHLSSSINAWDSTLPTHQETLAYSLDATMTHQLLVPPLFEDSCPLYTLASQQNLESTTNQRHLMSTQTHCPSPHMQQQHDQPPPSSSRSQPVEHTVMENIPDNNNSYVSAAVFPDFDLSIALDKQQHASNGNILWKYPLLVPALLSIIIDHTMTMSTDELLSHTRLLSTPTQSPAQPLLSTSINHANGVGGLKGHSLTSNSSLALGLRYQLQHNRCSSSTDAYPLSRKQLDALWDHLLNQMMKATPTSQQQMEQQEISRTSVELDTNVDDRKQHANDQHQTLWYDTPVTGFKAICPLYWMQRQLCRFVITYVIVKYPQLEMPCKTYLPICEQFRRRLITTSS